MCDVMFVPHPTGVKNIGESALKKSLDDSISINMSHANAVNNQRSDLSTRESRVGQTKLITMAVIRESKMKYS